MAVASFETRCKPDSGNLLLTYTVDKDHLAAALGHEYLGVGHDHEGSEVHVFKMSALDLPG